MENIFRLQAAAAKQWSVVSDSGAFLVPGKEEELLDQIASLLKDCGLNNYGIIVDVGASILFENGGYEISRYSPGSPKIVFDAMQLTEKYMSWLGNAPIIAFQDPFFHDELGAFKDLETKCEGKCRVMANQLYGSGEKRLRQLSTNK